MTDITVAADRPEPMPNEGLDHDEIIEQAERFYRDARNASAKWRQKAREDYAFVAGSQWSDEDKAVLAEQLRPVVVFNRVAPVIDSVAGAEVNNRQEVRFIPRTVGDAQVNDILTAAAKFMRDECDAEDEESDAFIDLVICGLGVTETRLDYETDPEGKVCVERIDPLEMYLDPRATKRNLSDSRAMMRVRRMARQDVEALWPDADIVGDAGPWSSDLADEATEAHDADAARFYRPENSAATEPDGSEQLTVVHYQWWDRETYWRIADPTTGQVAEFGEDDYARLSERMVGLGMPLKALRQTRRRYKQAYICGRTVLSSGDALCPEGFSFKCMTGKRDRNHGTWYGLVRAMKDPQRWANKWLSTGMHIFNSNSKGGLLAETGAFENPRKAEEDWADPTSITFLKPGGLQKIQPKTMAQFPQGMADLLTFGVSSIRDVTGVNLEMLGLADRDQPGVLETHRKQAALTVLASFFDSLRRYRKEQGRILLYIIRTYLSDGRLVRIEGPEVTQYLPLLRDPSTATYDVVVDDAPTSPNQKEAVWETLQTMLPALLQLGMPIPPDVLDYSPLPSVLSARWKSLILQQQQQPNPAAEAQQQQAQAAIALAQAQVQSAQAKAQGDAAKAQAEMHRARADMAATQVSGAKAFMEAQETQADIELKRANAAAAIAKARATLGSMGIDQLETIIRSLDTLHGNRLDEAQHGLDRAQAAHDAEMRRREHDLAVKQANKPQPAASR